MRLNFQNNFPEELPQSYSLNENHTSESSKNNFVDLIDEIQSKIKHESALALKCSEEDIQILPLSNIIGFKGKSGFRVVDLNALNSGKSDQIELLSVLILKSHDRSKQPVPIIITHTYPNNIENIPEKIKKSYEEKFFQEHNLYPIDLLKSKTRKWIEMKWSWIRSEPRNLVLFSIAATSILFISGSFGNSALQRLNEESKIRNEQLFIQNRGAEKLNYYFSLIRSARDRGEILNYLDNLFSDGFMGYSDSTKYLLNKLESNNEKDRIVACNTIRELLFIDFTRVDNKAGLPPIVGSYNGRALYDGLKLALNKERSISVKSTLESTVLEIQKVSKNTLNEHVR